MTPFSLNPRVVSTCVPPIPLAAEWATHFPTSASNPLVNLAQGVPGNPPPAEFMRRLGASAQEGSTTTYGDLRGSEGLRRELARDVNAVYGNGVKRKASVTVEDVCLTAGANLAFYATMVALAQAGDEIILPVPWYFNHQMTLTQLGIIPIPLSCSPPSFLPSPTHCRSLITPKTKAIVLVTPNNPTGAIYSPELIAEFADLAREKGVALVVDETYREFLDSRPHELFLDEEKDWRGVLIHLFSFSKSYAIPGHRLGAIIASPSFLFQAHKTLDCLQINPARVAQDVCEWGIEGIRDWRDSVRRDITDRGRMFRKLMESVGGWRVVSLGAYYAFVQHPFVGVSSEVVAERMARQIGVVVLPGTFFNPPFADVNQDRYLRFSIANVDSEKLRLVPARLEKLTQMWDD